MADTRSPVRPLERGDQDEVEVSPLELFFDLVGGVVVYLLAHVAFRWLVARELNPVRLGAATLLLAVWAPLVNVPALGQSAVDTGIVVTGIVVVALVIETVVFADRRREIRAERTHH